MALLLCIIPAQAKDSPRILVLFSYQLQLPWTQGVVAGIYQSVAQSGKKVQLDLQFLDQARNTNPDINADYRRLILDKYRDNKPDVIIAESAPANAFYIEQLAAHFPDVPVVFLRNRTEKIQHTPSSIEMTVSEEVEKTVALALQLHHPQTVYLLGDRGSESQQYLHDVQKALTTHPEVTIERLDHLSYAQLIEAVRNLPTGTIAFYCLIFHDGEGKPLIPNAALKAIAENSAIPIYSFWDPMIGHGAVGGHVISPERVGHQLFEEALHLAESGMSKATGNIAASSSLIFDDRQLSKWNIPTQKLPGGAEIRFAQVSFWDSYRNEIIGAIALLVLETLLIFGLLYNMRERRKAIAALAEERTSLEQRVKERTADLEQEKDRAQRYLDTVQTLMVALDHDGNITMINRAGCALLGYEESELLGQNWFTTCLPPESVETVYPVFQKIVSGQMSPHEYYENAVYLKDGRTRLFAWYNAFFHDDDGNITGTLSSGEDITERKQHETELLRAKELAEAANRAKSTFLANMSHELRTPMNGIMGMTDLALLQTTDSKLKKQLKTVQQSARHLLAIINDILDLSKIEAERLILDQQTFTLNNIMANLRSMISYKAEEKGLQVTTDLPTELAELTLKGDPLRLGQVLLNLAGNAVKFTEAGLVAVSVQLVENNADNVLLRWEIQDTGIGISPEAQLRLFTPFEQADGSMTRKYGGTGLGLAICKRLVELMDGQIGLQSIPEQGSTFWFTVRLNKVTATEPAKPLSLTSSAAQQIQTHHGGARILLAEDEPTNQLIVQELLEELGLQLDVAEDGVEAIALTQINRYALILMDMRMPNLNGIDATLAIRKESLNTDTPILALTANAYEEDRKQCLDAGMNNHFAKPFDSEKLLETILEMLEQKH